MMVNSFCGDHHLQSHAALYGEFLLVLHTLCWFMQGAPLACPHARLYGEFLLTPCAGLHVEFLLHAQCCFRCGVSLTHPMLASFSWEFLIRSMLASLCSKFLLYKTKSVKMNQKKYITV